MRDVPTAERSLRLAELLAAVSLATDLAHDVPAESALRDAVLVVELARALGWTDADVSDAFYLALLYHIGCTGAVAAQSRLGGGDDVLVRRWMSEADYANRPEMMRIAITRLAREWGLSGWAQGVAGLATAGRDLPDVFASIAEVASRLSERLGASPGVSRFPLPCVWPLGRQDLRAAPERRRPVEDGATRASRPRCADLPPGRRCRRRRRRRSPAQRKRVRPGVLRALVGQQSRAAPHAFGRTRFGIAHWKSSPSRIDGSPRRISTT